MTLLIVPNVEMEIALQRTQAVDGCLFLITTFRGHRDDVVTANALRAGPF